jgi:uncharacterized membrane protein
MFDTFNGLPLHPLVVHGVVVLLPLAILGTIAIALRPSWRTKYGVLVVGAALVATVLVPVSTSSGESLEERVGDPGEHAELGEQLLWFALTLVIAVTALVVLQWRIERATRNLPTGRPDRGETAQRADRGAMNVVRATAVLAVLAALACGVQVYRVGDSGARAAWGDAAASHAPR